MIDGWSKVTDHEYHHEDGRKIIFTPEDAEYQASWNLMTPEGEVATMTDTAAEAGLPAGFAQMVDPITEADPEEVLQPVEPQVQSDKKSDMQTVDMSSLPPLPSTSSPTADSVPAFAQEPFVSTKAAKKAAKSVDKKTKNNVQKDDAPENPRAVAGDNSGEDEVRTAAKHLRSIIDRFERLAEERAALGSDMKDLMGEAKSAGFDTKAVREVLRLRKMDPEVRKELRTLVDVYSNNIGMDE